MAITRINFGEWTPDQPGIAGTVTEAVNCYPVANGYAPLRDIANYSMDAGTSLLITFAGKYANATTLFAASATQIYKFDSSDTTLDPLTTTGYTSVSSWDVTQFGSQVILSNGTNKLQAYNLSSSTYVADLSADAPTAKFVTVVRDFVVAANVAGEESKVYWSDINNETNWTAGTTSQADSQVLPDGGNVTGIAGGEYGLIFLERAIYRMSYSGSPFFFQFDAISRTLGCISAGSIIQFSGLTYFLADDGFYSCNGQTVTPIGSEKINRWFLDEANLSAIANSTSATVDPIKGLIIWCYPSKSGGNGLLIYNIQLNKWSSGETTATSVSYILTPTTTLEQVDNYDANLDTLDISLDSSVWAGGLLQLAGVRNQKIVVFSGDIMSAYVGSNDIDIGRSMVTMARPIVDNGTASIAIASRALLSQQPEYGTYATPNTDNRCAIRSGGRYHRLKLKTDTAAVWNTIVGVEVEITNQGVR